MTAPPRTRSTTNSGQYSPPNWSTPASRARRILCSGVTLDAVGTLIDATMHGMVMMALAIPGMATHRTTAAPFGATAPQEWSLAALSAASIAAAFLEPDPAIEWDGERIAHVRQALTEITAAEV